MNKPLTKDQRTANEEFRYNQLEYELIQLISQAPDDTTKAFVCPCTSNEEAVKVRMALYNVRRTIRSFKYFKPDIRDKAARLTLAVQGSKLLLRLKPSQFSHDVAAKLLAVGEVKQLKEVVAESDGNDDGAMRSLAESFDLDLDTKPEPKDPDAEFDKVFPMGKK